ncbi:MAG: hypothetical protein GXP14_07310 [Gammaproteobacteria bacterium]|nr:hypothetical protein [Gammaproteobacteria bacterium]
MQYIKQLINILVGTTGVTTFPSEAAPGNGVSLAEVIRAMHADVTGLNGDVMRGTELAATATALATAQADLDTLTGADGVTLATSQPNYAPNTVVPDAAGVAATGTALTTAQNDLDILTGSDGATLATSQPNYAPNTVVPDAAGVVPTAIEVRQEIDSNSTQLAAIVLDTAEIGSAGAGLTNLGGMSTGMKAEINTEADTALTDYDPPTNAEMVARTPTAAQLAYIVSNSADGLPVTFTGGTTTTAILGNVDGVAASSTNDVYNGRVLVFNAGTLDQQVTDIVDYVGSTKTATITAVTTSVTSSHTANLK